MYSVNPWVQLASPRFSPPRLQFLCIPVMHRAYIDEKLSEATAYGLLVELNGYRQSRQYVERHLEWEFFELVNHSEGQLVDGILRCSKWARLGYNLASRALDLDLRLLLAVCAPIVSHLTEPYKDCRHCNGVGKVKTQRRMSC
jgi:hypothetical protein